MFEQITQMLMNAFSHMLGAYLNKLVPMVGVGESAEAVEYVAPQIIYTGLIVLAALGSFSA